MTADALIDRRRLRRKVTFWRAVAFVVALCAIVAAGLAQTDVLGTSGGDHIAKVRIEGTITEDQKLLERLKTIAESDTVKAVVINIDSPGGTTAGGEAIYEAVRKISENKPVVAQIGTLAASAGYMIASAGDHIIARQSSIVGSIGVIVQYPNVTELLGRIGVTVEDVKSSPLKAEPSPFNVTSAEERAMLERMVRDSFDWFVDLVAERRPLDRAGVLELADGSVFTGRQSLERKLVDALGGEAEAVAWLKDQDIAEDLEVIEWKRPRNVGLLSIQSVAGYLASRLLGVSLDTTDIAEAIQNEPLFLDGLVSVWHPAR